MTKIINILSTEYTINYRSIDTDPIFKKTPQMVVYCCAVTKRIVICDLTKHPDYADESAFFKTASEKETLRHEIVHAFLDESGLRDSALSYDGPWAKNEEMVDWIALIGPKIYKAWQEAEAI